MVTSKIGLIKLEPNAELILYMTFIIRPLLNETAGGQLGQISLYYTIMYTAIYGASDHIHQLPTE